MTAPDRTSAISRLVASDLVAAGLLRSEDEARAARILDDRLATEPVDAHTLLRHAVRTCPAEELERRRLTLVLDLGAAHAVVNRTDQPLRVEVSETDLVVSSPALGSVIRS